MTLKITPGSIASDGHVVLLPAGLTGDITTEDGRVYELGPAHQIAIEVDTHEHACEVAIAASKLAVAADSVPEALEFDEEQSLANFNTQEN